MTKPLTGKHVFAIFATAFGVIIAVNLTLAFNAVATFPGLETKNSYVVSQTFERDRSNQLALGWQVDASLVGEILTLQITDATGPISPHLVSATLGRATHVNQDQTPEFTFDGTAFKANVGALQSGNWNLRIVAQSQNGTEFRQRIVVRTKQ